MANQMNKKIGVVDIKLGVSRPELAKALNVSEVSVSRWFSGAKNMKLKLRQVRALLDVTGMTINELINVLEPDEINK